MKLIVGLGNPGRAYEHTRHNLGWDALTALAKKHSGDHPTKKVDWQAEVCQATVDGQRVLLAWPQTYMNLSGRAVQAIASFYKLDLTDILVVHDEMDFPVGHFAFAAEAGPGGHNGISSIQQSLASRAVPRLRLGIGRPAPPLLAEDFVLQPFTTDEQPLIKTTLTKAVTAMEDWISDGMTTAMQKWNKRAS